MNPPSATRQQLALWSLIFGLWVLLVLAFAGQLFFTAQMLWSEAVLISLRDWYPWLLFGPIVIWLALRFPLERQKLKWSIPVHVLGCAVAVLVYGVMVPRPVAGRGPPVGGGQPRFRGGLPEQRPVLPPDTRPALPPDRGRPFEPAPGLPEGRRPGQPPFPEGGPSGLRHLPDARMLLFNRAAMNARFNVPVYWVLVSVAHALTYYRRSQDRERRAVELEGRLSEAKLQSLRMQLHPHFLFNTLNAIAMLVHKDAKSADEMIANLSELLRATLDTSQQEIPLRRELAFLDRYLEIQQVRFGERLRIERRIDTATLGAKVPTLLLQPLVENAIRHGIEPQPGKGLVSINSERRQDLLCLEVCDNGQGLKDGLKQGEGIGLANTRARLQALYGDAGKLVLQSGPEGGCSVQVQIPFRDEDSSANH